MPPLGIMPGVDGACVRLAFDQPDSAAAAAAAGTYSARIKIPAHSLILDVGMHCVALWNAGTSAIGTAGDTDDPDGFLTDVNFKATDCLAGESVNLVAHGSQAGAYVVGTLPTGHWENRYSATAREIMFDIITVGTAPTTGETICWATWIEMDPSHPKGRLAYGTYVAT